VLELNESFNCDSATVATAQNADRKALPTLFGLSGTFTPNSSNEKYSGRSSMPVVITVNQTSTHQVVLGFGGAVTDAAGINILSLTHEASESLLRYRERRFFQGV